MADVAARSGKTYAVMQNRRYLPGIVRCRSLVESGAIGAFTAANADFYLGAHFGGFRDEMDHVLVLDMAIHTFDQARYLCGRDPVAVYCHEWNPAGSWYRHGACAHAVFEMTGGAVFSYRGSWCAEGCNTSWEADWRLCGSSGSLLWDGNAGLKGQRTAGDTGFTRPQAEVTVPAEPSMPHTGHGGCIRDFLDCVRAGRKPQTSYDDNIKSLAMVHAAIESTVTRTRVEIRV
jgi:predicted dehydrogenase